MTHDTFNTILHDRLTVIKGVLASKAKEYATEDGDRLQNFKDAAILGNTTPERALKGMLLKHLVSVFMIIDELDKGKIASRAMIDEKLGDSINYFILLEALLKERLDDAVVSYT